MRKRGLAIVASMLGYIAVAGHAAAAPMQCTGVGRAHSWSDAVYHFLNLAFNDGRPPDMGAHLHRRTGPLEVELVGYWGGRGGMGYRAEAGLYQTRRPTGLANRTVPKDGNVIAFRFADDEHLMARLREQVATVSATEADAADVIQRIGDGRLVCWMGTKNVDVDVVGKAVVYVSPGIHPHQQEMCLNQFWMGALGLAGAYRGGSRKIESVKDYHAKPLMILMTPIDKCALSIAYSRHFRPGMTLQEIHGLVEEKGEAILEP
ncbi:hypothetical protein [Arenibaculum sp.]|uniref:hypothetical protein n=1 Tax=Arenibaculum sp. TaxID=2865862 RepID=UPI002E0F10CA|nr:hypothetical protein [Arenibaculum sp.]